MNRLGQTGPVEIANRLVGPFSVGKGGIDGYPVHDNDMAIIAWVMGSINARRVTGALNLAYDCGLLD